MFISYLFTHNNEMCFGYMCFSGMISEDKVVQYLQEILFVKTVLIIAQIPYIKNVNNVVFYNKKLGLVQIGYNKPLCNVGEIGNLYSMLYRKYGFCNIMKFYE